MPNTGSEEKVALTDSTTSSEMNIAASKQEKKLAVLVVCLLLLFLLCFANLVTLLLMYSTLGLSTAGMETLSFHKDARVKWMVDTQLEHINLHGGLHGYVDQDVRFISQNQDLELSVEDFIKSSIKITPDKGTVMKTQSFRFVDADAGVTILDLNGISYTSLVGEFQGDTIRTETIRTPRIVSPTNKDLFIESEGNVTLTGNEGLYAASKQILFSAKKDVRFKISDPNYELSFGGSDGGVAIRPSRVSRSKLKEQAQQVDKFRLCMCTKTGQLFAASMHSDKLTCSIATENPCA